MKRLGFIALAALGVTGARAADLPLAEPAEYVKICDAYGNGFFYIPGTDTCIRLAGFVRSDFRWEDDDLNDAWNDTISDVRGRIQTDVRSETEWGTLRTVVEFELRSDGNPNNGDGNYDDGYNQNFLRQGFIQFAGITAGHIARSFYDFVPYKHIGDTFSDERVNTFAYTASLADGIALTVGVEDKYFRAQPADISAGGSTYKALDQVWPNAIAALNIKQTWGEAQISAAVQDNEGDYTHVSGSDDIGWAVQAGLSVNLPTEVKGSKIWAIGAYTEGALSYIGSEEWLHPRNEGLGNGNFRDQNLTGTGAFVNTEAWSVGGGFAWAWSSKFTSNVGAIYSEIDQAVEDDFDHIFIEANTYWTPLPSLSLALAVQYTDTEVTTVAGPNSSPPSDDDHWAVVTRIERSF